MTTDAGATARAAWARLAGLEQLARLTVVVDPLSPVCRAGWIGILALDGTVTAIAPTEGLRRPLRDALDELPASDATRPEIVRPRLPPTGAVLGPATLSYPPPDFDPGGDAAAELVAPTDLKAFVRTIASDDLDESGFSDDEVDAVHGSWTAAGELAAVSGYRRWPNGVAHLSILTAPGHRRRGHAREAARAALRAALDEGLLPQWRARVPASQALALALGLVPFGAQLGLEPR